MMSGHQFAIRIKPGERSRVGGVSYVALIPHSILAVDLHKPLYKNLFLVEYWKEGRKKEWVSIKDLEERGVIKLIDEDWRELGPDEIISVSPGGDLGDLLLIKKPDLKFFVAVLQTLAEQGFIDVEPTEGDYDATPIYDFLVVGGFAERVAGEKYWLRLINPDACEALADLLKRSQPDLFEEAKV